MESHIDWKLDNKEWKVSLTLKKVVEEEWKTLFVVIVEIPLIFQYADDNKVNEVIKIFKDATAKEDEGAEKEEKELSSQDLLALRHPIKGYTIMGWATVHRKYPVIEYLLRRLGGKRVANITNEQEFEILKEWQKEQRRLKDLENKPKETKDGDEDEEEKEKPVDFATSLLEKFEKFTVERIKEIGAFGIYEGDLGTFEIPVEVPQPESSEEPVTAEEHIQPETKENTTTEESGPIEETNKKESEENTEGITDTNEEKQEEGEEEKAEEEEKPEGVDNEEETAEEENTEENTGGDNEEKTDEDATEKKPKSVRIMEPPKPVIVKYRHGFGSAYYLNDDIYIGFFDNTVREGMGTYIYRGQFAEDLKKKKQQEKEAQETEEENQEEEINLDQISLCYYAGDWKENKKHGKGRMLYHNGDRFYGEYVEDKKECERGIYLYRNGDMYVGRFHNDEKDGEGVYTFAADGSSLEGQWQNGAFVSGQWNWKDGKISFSSSDFAKKSISGSFAFASYIAEGTFTNGKWKVTNITH